MTETIEGQLEIDHERGVIYFHTNEMEKLVAYEGVTILRICSLPKPIPKNQMIDITHMCGVNYSEDVKTPQQKRVAKE